MKNSTISFIVIGIFSLYNGVCSFLESDVSEFFAWLLCLVSEFCIYKQNELISYLRKTIDDLCEASKNLRNNLSEKSITVTPKQLMDILEQINNSKDKE